MSLVPFSSSTPATGLPPAVRPATPAVSARPVTGGPSPLASPRAHTVVRESASSAGATGKGRAAFASVLAAAQDQGADVEPVVAEMATSASRSVTPDTRPDVARKDLDEVPVLVNDLRMPAAPESQTPWLLLALGVGGWSDGLSATTVVSEDTPATGTEGDGAADALTPLAASVAEPVVTAPILIAPAVVASVPSALPVAAADAGPADTTASLAAALPSASQPLPPLAGVPVAEGPAVVSAPGESLAHAQSPADAGAVPTLEALPVTSGADGLDPVAGTDVRPEPSREPAGEARDAASVPAADVLARWRTASRGTDNGRDHVLPGVGVSGDGEPVTARPLAPGQAVNRLAQALGQAVTPRTDGPSGGPSVPVAGQLDPMAVTPAASAAPTARATEVLSRLAQGSLPGAARKTSDAGAASAVFAQMLSTAMPTPTADAPAVTAPATPLPAAAGEHVLAQMVSFLKLQWKDGVGEAKLHLRPDALGSVSVSLKVEGGAVTAVVRADNPQVQEWILQHQPSLRQQMEAAGLHLDELVVSPDDQRQSQGQQSQEREGQPRQRVRRVVEETRVDGERFEMLL